MSKVYFELHILPMFRLTDRDHMLTMGSPKFDLFSYDDVRRMTEGTKDQRPMMREWIEGKRMPTASTGGPWPDEWIALFKRWATDPETPYARLPRAEVKDNGWSAVRSTSGVITLTARGTKPNSADIVWIQRLTAAESPREYIIYREPLGPPGPSIDFTTQEKFLGTNAGNVIIVNDASGVSKEIKIQG